VLPFCLVYSDNYDLHFGEHVFPTRKYKLIHRRLQEIGVARAGDFLAPSPITRDQLLLVHSAEWVNKLESGTLTYHEVVKLEVPYSRQMVDAVMLQCGGTLLASRRALEGQNVCINIGGGFHHAFAGHGEGFCALNDIAVAVRVLQAERRIERAMVIDLDVHQGNGTASIFSGDGNVFTLSLHQFDNYPFEKPPSTLDVHLADHTGDAEYLEKLHETLIPAVEEHKPELAIYVAGTDPYLEDQLGGLALTKAGMKRRDRFVFETCRGANVPVAAVLAGGYARKLEDTVELHTNMVLAAREVYL